MLGVGDRNMVSKKKILAVAFICSVVVDAKVGIMTP